MLVLTRKAGEEIVINGSIRVKVLAIDKSKIRLGIVAPPEVPIIREELLERMAVQPQSVHGTQQSYTGLRMAKVPTATSA